MKTIQIVISDKNEIVSAVLEINGEKHCTADIRQRYPTNKYDAVFSSTTNNLRFVGPILYLIDVGHYTLHEVPIIETIVDHYTYVSFNSKDEWLFND